MQTQTQDPQPQSQAETPDIRDLMQQADEGTFAPPTPAPEPTEPTPPTEQAGDDKPEAKPEDATPQPEGKPESKYARAKKEAERRDRSWKALEEEKERFRAEREEFERSRQAAPQQQANAQQQAAPGQKDQHGFSAKDYEDYADKAEDPREVREALRRAAELRAGESRQSLQAAQQESIARAIKERPELEDEKSPLAVKVKELIGRVRVFSALPDGFERAVEVADALVKSERVDSAEARVKELEAEVAKLRGAVQPNPGNPGGAPPKKKDIMELPEEERSREVRALVEQFDDTAFSRR